MKYKAEIRVPTDTYAYINIWVEEEPEEVIRLHNQFQALYRASQRTTDAIREPLYPVGGGLPDKEWRKVLDTYMDTGILENGAETYSKMNQPQQTVIQEIKKAFARAEYRKEKEIEEEEIAYDNEGPGKGEGGNWENQD